MKYLIIIAVALCSCKVSRNVQKFAKQVDSTAFFKSDSTHVVRVDSVSIAKDNIIATHVDSADYEEWLVVEEDSAVKKTTIHIRDKGVRRSKVIVHSKDSSSTHKVDSTTGSTIAIAHMITDEHGKDLQVKKTQGGLWINLAILLALVGAGYYVYRRFFA